MPEHKNKINVSSEIGRLRRLLVHSPDSGLGKVVPSKAQDWLFEDLVHLDTIRRHEYDYYIKLLLYFMDPEKIQGRLKEVNHPDRNFFKPGHKDFYKSDQVIEIEWLLTEILLDKEIKLKLVASVCAIENCSYEIQDELMNTDAADLARIFISGTSNDKEMLFPPVPNFIFTRDIGIVINDAILLNKPAMLARTREALLMKYIFFNHPLFEPYREKIIELKESPLHFLSPGNLEEKRVTLEGGDVMVVTKDHVLIGISERTTVAAAYQAIHQLFERDIVKKVSVVRIPHKRDYMHIDTIFTQVKRNTWVMLGVFSKKHVKKEDADEIQRALTTPKKDETIQVTQFRRKNPEDPVYFDNLEDLLVDISRNDLKSTEKTRFIYSGNNEFPFDVREQWTDSCNLLAIREGVVVGYDRNDKTLEAFKKAGYNVVHVVQLLEQFEDGSLKPDKLENTYIVVPSAELSRARGGFHCMSMPLLRDEISALK
jgi:arginine deiminase